MTTVYLVFEEVMYEGRFIHGIYSNREAAEAHARALRKEDNKSKYWWYEVEDHEVADHYEEVPTRLGDS